MTEGIISIEDPRSPEVRAILERHLACAPVNRWRCAPVN